MEAGIVLSFNAAFERFEPPCSKRSYRSDQGYLSERIRGAHPSGRVPGIMGLQELCLNIPAGNGGGPYLRRFAVR